MPSTDKIIRSSADRDADNSIPETIRLIIDSTPALIHTARPDGYIDFFNETWLRYVGVPLEDIQGWNWTSAIHPDDLEGILEKWRASLATGEHFLHETRVRTASGEYRWMLHHKVAQRDERGNIVKWYGASVDIEERKRAEEELRRNAQELQRSESYLADGQRLAHTGSWAFGPGGFDYWSPELFRIHGLDPAGKPPTLQEYLDLIHPEDREFMETLIRRILVEPARFDATKRIVCPDGEVRYVRCAGAPVLDSTLKKFVGSAIDVTEHELLTQELRRREAELRLILDTIPQQIAALSPNGEVLYANQSLLEYLGSEDVKTEGSRRRFVHPDDLERLHEKRRRGFEAGQPFEQEMRLLGKDGRYRWFLTHYNPLRDHQAQIIRWYATSTDIDDRKRNEELLKNETVALREELNRASMFEEIVGSSTALRKVLSDVAKVAPTDSTVLITGETGTGKELIARAIHKRSRRSARAFVSVNCAAIPQSLIASELFGHEKGAFTGALHRRLGRFELAEGGTIFLDEIGDLPADMQTALLRVLQEREFERVGGSEPIRANVRVIAATNRNLKVATNEGAFRNDLFYRLNVFPIEMPPLRARKEDIPMLVEYFIDRYASNVGKKICGIDKTSMALLRSYSWPGNIRELQNVIERSLIVCEGETLVIDDNWLSKESITTPVPGGTLSEEMISREKERIEAALALARGRVSGPRGAAANLGVPRSTLDSKIRSLKIDKNRFRSV